ncbi:MAG TPA: hypothetical protein VGD63_01810, partial [Steroidobacteraceae bacterium]
MLKNVMWMSSVASLMAALAACAVGPTYHRPETPASEPRNIAGAHFSTQEPNAAWWEQFEDPVLADLEARALAESLDLHVAIARVHSARAAFSEAQFNYAPHVQLDGSYSRSKEQFPGFTTDRLDIQNASIGFDAT